LLLWINPGACDRDAKLFGFCTWALMAGCGQIAFERQFCYKIAKFELTPWFKISIDRKPQISQLHESTDCWNYHG